MWLRSGTAVALVEADSCSSDSTPSLGTSICFRCGPKKTKKQNRKLDALKCCEQLGHAAVETLSEVEAVRGGLLITCVRGATTGVTGQPGSLCVRGRLGSARVPLRRVGTWPWRVERAGQCLRRRLWTCPCTRQCRIRASPPLWEPGTRNQGQGSREGPLRAVKRSLRMGRTWEEA